MWRTGTALLIILELLGLVCGYTTDLDLTNIHSCRKKFEHKGRYTPRNPDFSNFTSLDSFVNLKNDRDEIMKMRFYFKGTTDFHVLLSEKDRLPEPDEKPFNICKYIFCLFSINFTSLLYLFFRAWMQF